MSKTATISTAVGHCQEDDCSVYVGRDMDEEVSFKDYVNGRVELGDEGCLGNPYPLRNHSRQESVAKFTVAFEARLESDAELREFVAGLCGEDLGCWCQQLHEDDGDLCHGEVIAHHAERLGGEQ